MLITIGDKTMEMMNVLGMSDYPFTSNDLKKYFRESCFKYHSDTGGSNASNVMFNKCMEANKYLENLCNDVPVSAKKNKSFKFDMFDLTEPCESCNGTGTIYAEATIRCPDCDGEYFDFFMRRGSGRKTLKCNRCDNGLFTLKSGRKVTCRTCSGTGVFKIVRCRTCSGIGLITKKVGKECMDCGGEGKIHLKPMNPVIRKGAVLYR